MLSSIFCEIFKNTFLTEHLWTTVSDMHSKKLTCTINNALINNWCWSSETVAQRCSVKKGLWHRCFPVNFAKYLRPPFFYRTPLVAACRSYNQSFDNFRELNVSQQLFKMKRQQILSKVYTNSSSETLLQEETWMKNQSSNLTNGLQFFVLY